MTRVEVTWTDTAANAIGWMTPEDAARESSSIVVRSVGWLLSSSRASVVIVQSLQDRGLVADALVIPRGVVRKVRTLR